MAFLVTSASSSLAYEFPIDVSVTFLYALVNVHLTSDIQCGSLKKCVRMRRNGLFTAKKYKKISDPTPHCSRFAPIIHSKILGTPLLCPVLKMKSWRICICVPCHFLCISLLLGSFCNHCTKCMLICSVAVRV